jgi:phosphoglycolate phosphatase
MGFSKLAAGCLRQVMTVGADLDVTLIDTRKATAVAIEKVNADCGAAIEVEVFLSRLGLPIRDELARWMPADRVSAAVQVFRVAFLADGLQRLRPLPGAEDLISSLGRRGGRLIVITSRIPRICYLGGCDSKEPLCPNARHEGS